jgi:hypothetical protein
MTKRAAEHTTMDAHIAAAFADDATSANVARLLSEVETAANAADAAAEEARVRALDPLLSSDGVAVARREMDDAAFKRDRLKVAAAKLAERVEALKALEAERHARAEHQRILAERTRLAEEMGRFAEPILEIARLLAKIDLFDQEIRSYNLRPTRLGYVRPVLSGDASVVEILLQDGPIRGAFTDLVARQSPKATKAVVAALAPSATPPDVPHNLA